MHPNHRVRSRRHRTLRQIRKTDAFTFFDLLTDEATLDQVDSLLPTHRAAEPAKWIPPHDAQVTDSST